MPKLWPPLVGLAGSRLCPPALRIQPVGHVETELRVGCRAPSAPSLPPYPTWMATSQRSSSRHRQSLRLPSTASTSPATGARALLAARAAGRAPASSTPRRRGWVARRPLEHAEQCCCQTLHAAGGPSSTSSVLASGPDGAPSTVSQAVLLDVLRRYNVSSMMDSSCGSMHWMPLVRAGACLYVWAGARWPPAGLVLPCCRMHWIEPWRATQAGVPAGPALPPQGRHGLRQPPPSHCGLLALPALP